jgi:hypothetical protein
VTRSETLTANERVKTISTYFANLSAAVAAAAAARVWTVTRFDPASFVWAMLAALLLAGAWAILYLLEPESSG